jgi:hypothetical protein
VNEAGGGPTDHVVTRTRAAQPGNTESPAPAGPSGMGDTGLEPVTPSLSSWCCQHDARRLPSRNPCKPSRSELAATCRTAWLRNQFPERLCRVCAAGSATSDCLGPPGHAGNRAIRPGRKSPEIFDWRQPRQPPPSAAARHGLRPSDAREKGVGAPRFASVLDTASAPIRQRGRQRVLLHVPLRRPIALTADLLHEPGSTGLGVAVGA